MQSDRGEIELYMCHLSPHSRNAMLGAPTNFIDTKLIKSDSTNGSESDGEERGTSGVVTSSQVPYPSSEELSDAESDALASPMKNMVNVSLPSPPSRVDLEEESRSSNSDLGHIKNVLIAASEDLGPMGRSLQQQTTDQNHSNQGTCVELNFRYEFFLWCLWCLRHNNCLR